MEPQLHARLGREHTTGASRRNATEEASGEGGATYAASRHR